MTDDRPGASAWDGDRTIVRFPDPAIEVVDERFRSLVVVHEVVERLWTGGRWLEGPVWFGDGRYLLFSDIPNNRMLSWSEATGEVTAFPPGSLVVLPGDTAHFHWAKVGEYITQVTAIGPLGP